MKLELKEIKKSFGEKEVLKGISFAAESGRALGLLGRNGAGKTTSIRILMDVFPADSGQVLLDGRAADYNRLRIGYLPEERGLYPKKTIIAQLVYFAQLKGMKKADATASVDRWLVKLHMEEHRNKRLDTLSKGNQQKIQLITAVCFNPDIVILDEPFSGLDPVNAMLLKDVVRELIKDGKIVLFSSHQMNYIEEFCDDIVILNGGEVVLAGGLKEIIRAYPRDKLVVSCQNSDSLLRELKQETTMTDEGVLVKLDRPEDKKQVMNDIVSRFDVDSVKVFEPSLNDIFVEYTKDGI